jgi:hypothetical protein
MVQSVGFFVSETSAIAAAVSSCAIAKPASQYFMSARTYKSSARVRRIIEEAA